MDVHVVGRRHLSEGRSDHRGGHRAESEWCVADGNCAKETSQGEVGSKQLVNGREVVIMDKEHKKKLETEEHVPVPK